PVHIRTGLGRLWELSGVAVACRGDLSRDGAGSTSARGVSRTSSKELRQAQRRSEIARLAPSDILGTNITKLNRIPGGVIGLTHAGPRTADVGSRHATAIGVAFAVRAQGLGVR